MAFEVGFDLALMKVKKQKQPHAGIGFSVKSCEEVTKKLEQQGAKIISRCKPRNNNHIILTQIHDPDGNVIWFAEHLN